MEKYYQKLVIATVTSVHTHVGDFYSFLFLYTFFIILNVNTTAFLLIHIKYLNNSLHTYKAIIYYIPFLMKKN